MPAMHKERKKQQRNKGHPVSDEPGTHWMRLATMALKWARMSLRISASLSFSASSSIRVISTYSRKRAPKARVSRSRAPFVLHQEDLQIETDQRAAQDDGEQVEYYLSDTCRWWRPRQPAAQRCAAAGVSAGLASRAAFYSENKTLNIDVECVTFKSGFAVNWCLNSGSSQRSTHLRSSLQGLFHQRVQLFH